MTARNRTDRGRARSGRSPRRLASPTAAGSPWTQNPEGQLRRWGWRCFWLLAPCGLAAVLLVGWPYFTELGLFRLHDLTVEGVRGLKEGRVLELAALEKGENLLRLDLREVEKRIEADPRVARAHVRIRWPSGLLLQIKEREPVARILGRGFLDGRGFFWEGGSRWAHLDLPLVTGVTEGLGKRERSGLFKVAVRLLRGAKLYLSHLRLSELSFGPEGLVLYFEGGLGPVLLGYGRGAEKLELLSRFLRSRSGKEVAGVLDLRWKGRVIARPAADTVSMVSEKIHFPFAVAALDMDTREYG